MLAVGIFSLAAAVVSNKLSINIREMEATSAICCFRSDCILLLLLFAIAVSSIFYYHYHSLIRTILYSYYYSESIQIGIILRLFIGHTVLRHFDSFMEISLARAINNGTNVCSTCIYLSLSHDPFKLQRLMVRYINNKRFVFMRQYLIQ